MRTGLGRSASYWFLFFQDLYWDITNIYSMNNVKDLNFAEFELSSMVCPLAPGIPAAHSVPQDFKILLMTFTFNACWFTGLRLKGCKLSDAQVTLFPRTAVCLMWCAGATCG